MDQLTQISDPKSTQNSHFGSVDPENLDQSFTEIPSKKTADPKVTQNRPKKAIQKSDSKPSEVAKKWLLDHPKHGLSVREAAIKANVSFGTMQRAMKDQE